MKRLVSVFVMSVVILSVLGTFAGVFTTSEKMIVANQLIGIVRVPAGGLTADKRVDRINERLAYILGYERLTPDNIYAVQEKYGEMSIMVGDRLLVRVTAGQDARANAATVSELTREWLSRAKAIVPQARPKASVRAR